MEKWMIVYVLPLEVWMDIFCFPWINRADFGQIVDRIGNFKFAEHAQFYLHEWDKHKLGNLVFKKEGLSKFVYSRHYHLEYPQTPMPENIKSFSCIQISHFDAQTMDFLGKIQPLLTNLEILLTNCPPKCLEALRTILTNLAPMLDGILSLFCANVTEFPMILAQLFRKNEQIAKLKMLEMSFSPGTVSKIEQQEMVAFITNWLAQPDNDGPRLLDLCFSEQVLSAIRKQFLVAKTPSTFAVNYELHFGEERHAAEFHLANAIGEELHGIRTEVEARKVLQITRHPANWNTKEAQKWIDEMTKGREYRRIWIENPTIGSIDAAQMAVPQVDEEQGDQQKPCSSKDA